MQYMKAAVQGQRCCPLPEELLPELLLEEEREECDDVRLGGREDLLGGRR